MTLKEVENRLRSLEEIVKQSQSTINVLVEALEKTNEREKLLLEKVEKLTKENASQNGKINTLKMRGNEKQLLQKIDALAKEYLVQNGKIKLLQEKVEELTKIKLQNAEKMKSLKTKLNTRMDNMGVTNKQKREKTTTRINELSDRIKTNSDTLKLFVQRREREVSRKKDFLYSENLFWMTRLITIDGCKVTKKCNGKTWDYEDFEAFLSTPWKLFPEEYEVECQSCKTVLSVIDQLFEDKNTVNCTKCLGITPLGQPKPGFRWIVFSSCSHYDQVPKGHTSEEWPDNCSVCGNLACWITPIDYEIPNPRRKGTVVEEKGGILRHLTGFK